VGSMPFGGTARTLPSVHPHVRGEHATPTARTAPSNGSPPRAWGASGTRAVRRTFSRFTPTCVGSMAPSRAARSAITVHPHVRGEHDLRRRRGLLRERFTPTCVGSMHGGLLVAVCQTVHPHVRGEHSFPSLCERRACGSPPRAWGAFPLEDDRVVACRFTPTCVGSMRR